MSQGVEASLGVGDTGCRDPIMGIWMRNFEPNSYNRQTMDLQNNLHKIKTQEAKETVLRQESSKLLFRWMDQHQKSQVLAREVQSNTADFNKFRQESELNIQALQTKQTAKDLEIDELKIQLQQAFQEFELERSALTALLLTEREDTRVLTQEYHFKAEALDGLRRKHWQTIKDLEQRLSQACQERKQYMMQCEELQDAQGKLTLQLEDQCKDLEQRLSQALQERQQYKLQNEELQDAQGKLTLKFQEQCKDLEQRLSQALQERQQYKLQCEELQDAQGKLTAQLEDKCKADKEAKAKALQRQQKLADQLQVLQDQNSTLAQQLANLEDDKRAMNKVLQELKENLQLQEDQSRSVATQISAIKCEVAPPQLHKEVQGIWELRLEASKLRSELEATHQLIWSKESANAPVKKAPLPSSPPHPTSPHAPKVAPPALRVTHAPKMASRKKAADSSMDAPPRPPPPPGRPSTAGVRNTRMGSSLPHMLPQYVSMPGYPYGLVPQQHFGNSGSAYPPHTFARPPGLQFAH
ncbi:hypothetical protein ABBQ38_003437 [Trebouxia sp. C0009 RCD-2024]